MKVRKVRMQKKEAVTSKRHGKKISLVRPPFLSDGIRLNSQNSGKEKEPPPHTTEPRRDLLVPSSPKQRSASIPIYGAGFSLTTRRTRFSYSTRSFL